MFASLSRFRRQIAVLTALAMMASVLVAVPAVAADPKADYKATFDACVGVGSANFEDVPANHANAGDIDCIAYYGITKGTSATTYSPLMSVTREHMALFLVRLAGRVGIAVASDPSDPGFTDTGDLSAESQTAIAQLADLGITKGKSVNTYSPADNVSRAHMALFIARLMDKMTPAADGQVGLSSTTQHGYTPANVAKNAKEADIGSPFTDLGSSTKDEYDAITRLYELGVASGISATSYSPSSDMTRAAMAEFMAAVMDHSNLRPAGLSIQATPTTSWGAGAPTVVVSVRDDMFMAVEDQAVDVFSSAAANNGLRKDGTCNFGTNPDDVLGGNIDGDCVWNDNDDATDADGNLFTSGDVAEGTTRVFYAWIGSKNGDKFDADTADEATVSVSAKAAQASLKASSSINKKADTTYDGDGDGTVEVNAEDQLGAKVDLRAVSSVTFSAQLKDSDGANVARSGVSVRVEYKQDDSYQNTHEATLTTDDAGMVSFPVNGPSNGKGDDSRADEVIFTELDSSGAPTARTDTGKVYWVEETPVITDSALEVADYLMDGSSISVGARVRLYDQYGNPHRPWSGQTAAITIGESTATGGDPANNVATRDVISRGYARWSRSVTHDDDTDAGDSVTVSYTITAHKRNAAGILIDANDAIIDSDTGEDGVQGTTDETDADVSGSLVVIYVQTSSTTPQSVNIPVVRPANSQDDVATTVTHVLGDNDKFLASINDSATPTLAYSYDSDDIFINSSVTEGTLISMDKFESTIDNNADGIANTGVVVKVQVLVYDADGSSIFEITATE